MNVKKMTTDCNGVKVTITYDSDTDATLGLKLDVGVLSVETLTTVVTIAQGLLDRGRPDVD